MNLELISCKFYTDFDDKRDTFSFSMVNFPQMNSNIPSKPVYGVVISQLVRYLRIFVVPSKRADTRSNCPKNSIMNFLPL